VSKDASPSRRSSHPFLGDGSPVAIAHRGGAEEAPENTMEAFSAAVALGYRYLETDAHVSRDGVVVAFHDPCLDAPTNRQGEIAKLTIAEIEAADAGWSFSPDEGRSFPYRDRGVRVPRLEELLLRWPQVRVNIDPKSDASVDPLVTLIDRLGAWERICIGSFSDRRLRRVRALSRDRACTSMGPRAVAIARSLSLAGRIPRQGAGCIQVPIRSGRVRIVSGRFVRAAHRAGLRVHVWTINERSTMHELLDLGVDGIMTDRPRVLRDVFVERGLRL
jgi:glycerophosphoryl diester phosphodiesterase